MFNSLRIDSKLKDPTFWKILQLYVNLMTAIVPIIAIFIPEFQAHLLNEALVKVMAALAAFNSYFTIATTDTLGILPREDKSLNI
jgi:hypothetical protein